MPHYVYILKLADGTLYVGSTNNLETRLKDHRRWAGGAFTRIPGAKELLYSEELPDKYSALRREHQLKGWSRAKKLALITGNLVELKKLARTGRT